MKTTPAALQAAASGDLDNFVAASTPGGIEAQEAAGQQSFVANETLPKECPREALEALGFVFGDDADDIFINVQFPEGWTKKPTDHSMWSDLLDDQGRKRGSIFYKAAFYDRSSHMNLDRRFCLRQDYEAKEHVQYRVLDGDSIVFETDKVECDQYSDKYWEAEQEMQKVATGWLNENYPDWENPSAYWN